MARHDAGWWKERVAELERSGDAERIARSYRVTVKLLKWWRWRLRDDGRQVAEVPRRHPRGRASEQRLLPIVVAPTEERALDDASPTTVIETTRGRISIRGALSAEQLGAVVAELVREC